MEKCVYYDQFESLLNIEKVLSKDDLPQHLSTSYSRLRCCNFTLAVQTFVINNYSSVMQNKSICIIRNVQYHVTIKNCKYDTKGTCMIMLLNIFCAE